MALSCWGRPGPWLRTTPYTTKRLNWPESALFKGKGRQWLWCSQTGTVQSCTGGPVLSVPFPINKIGEQSLCVWAVGAGFFLRRSWMYLYPWTPSTFGRQFAGFELCYLGELLWLFARPVHVILSFFGLSSSGTTHF